MFPYVVQSHIAVPIPNVVPTICFSVASQGLVLHFRSVLLPTKTVLFFFLLKSNPGQ